MFPGVELVRNVSFVDAGHALTSVGGAKSFDVAMWLVERLYGRRVAKGIGRGLVIDWDVTKIPRRVVGEGTRKSRGGPGDGEGLPARPVPEG